jgi:hypothetical protein
VAHTYPDKEYKEDYPPFMLLKKTYLQYLKEKNIKRNKSEQELEILKIWASAHGLAAIACMSGVETSFDWKDALSTDSLLR